MNEVEKDYRELLKKASRDKKVGPYRIAIPLIGGLIIVYIGITQARMAVGLMGLMLSYLAYLHYESYKQSVKMLKALQHLASNWQKVDVDKIKDLD